MRDSLLSTILVTGYQRDWYLKPFYILRRFVSLAVMRYIWCIRSRHGFTERKQCFGVYTEF